MDPSDLTTGLDSYINRLFCPFSKILPGDVLIWRNLFALYLLPTTSYDVHKAALAGDIQSNVVYGGHEIAHLHFRTGAKLYR